MTSQHVKYVLVGGGMASGAAAAAIRRHDPEGSMLLAGQEVNRPYYRQALSRGYLLGQQHRAELFTLADRWFGDSRVELSTGRRAMRLDVTRHSVLLDSGQEVGFQKLLIATGASPVRLEVPGSDLPNVFYLRTIEHADRLRNGIEKALLEGRRHDGGRGCATVIGAGTLGLELAWTLGQRRLLVDVVEAGVQPLWKLSGETVGRLLTHRLEAGGVRVHLQAAPVRLEGDGRVQRVVLSTGESIDADFVVAAIGVKANKQILRGTPIASENAILADEHCRTSHADIFAAGDCAAVFDPLFGRYRPVDHWEMAIATGQIAGSNMAGVEARYDQVTGYSSELLGLRLRAFGDPRHVERRIVRGNTNVESPDFIEIGVGRSGRIAQVLAVNHEGEDELLRELVRRRLDANAHDGVLRDPGRRLGELLTG